MSKLQRFMFNTGVRVNAHLIFHLLDIGTKND